MCVELYTVIIMVLWMPSQTLLDTGFRGIVRSGIRFTQNLKDIFESSIDPIVGLADTPAIRAATENMGGMFANIGLNGESAQKAFNSSQKLY